MAIWVQVWRMIGTPLLTLVLVLTMWLTAPALGSFRGSNADLASAVAIRWQAWFTPWGIFCIGECEGGICCGIEPYKP